jgi:ent-kaurene oxidase
VRPRVVNLKIAKMTSDNLQWREETTVKTIPTMAWQVVQNVVQLAAGKETTIVSLLITLIVAWVLYVRFVSSSHQLFNKKKLPPSIPGLPVLGNLLQLMKEKPHHTFTSWAQNYGPIFSIQVGSIKQVIITSPEIAKEAVITKFDSISTKVLPLGLKIMAHERNVLVMANYGDDHRFLRKLVVGNLLNANSQKQNRPIREHAMFSILDTMFSDLKHSQTLDGVIDVREYIVKTIFPFAMSQVWGYMPEKVDCPELGVVTKQDIFDACISNPMKAFVEIDWRDFFPAFKWVPNKTLENKIKAIERRRTLIMKGLVQEQRKSIEKEGPKNCYADIVLTQDNGLNDTRMELVIWDTMFTSSDTTLLTSEWILFELSKNPLVQERLYQEIVGITKQEGMVTEDDIPNMPYLNAIVKETLRKYPPVAVLPGRYADKDVTLGGYDIPKGWQVLLIKNYFINTNHFISSHLLVLKQFQDGC